MLIEIGASAAPASLRQGICRGGCSHDRKPEQAPIARDGADLALAAKMRATKTRAAGILPSLREVLSLRQDIRGYGPVRDAAFRPRTGRGDKTAAVLAAE